MAFGAVAAIWLARGSAAASRALGCLRVPAHRCSALAAAGYSAFLFGQAEGRDFWQSPLVLPHLLVAALVAGSAVLLLASIALPDALPAGAHGFPRRAVQWRVHSVLGPFVALAARARRAAAHRAHQPSPVQDVAVAARLLTRGEYRTRFWAGVVLTGTVLPMILLLAGAARDTMSLTALAALLALAGLWLWEDLWVKAGQSVPLS